MAVKFVDYQKHFSWRVNADGLPVGEVISLGDGRWLTVCPLCGCAHDVTAWQETAYKPFCSVRKTHPLTYVQWIRDNPEAAQHTTVFLKARSLEIEPFTEVLPTKKRGRKKVA